MYSWSSIRYIVEYTYELSLTSIQKNVYDICIFNLMISVTIVKYFNTGKFWMDNFVIQSSEWCTDNEIPTKMWTLIPNNADHENLNNKIVRHYRKCNNFFWKHIQV